MRCWLENIDFALTNQFTVSLRLSEAAAVSAEVPWSERRRGTNLRCRREHALAQKFVNRNQALQPSDQVPHGGRRVREAFEAHVYPALTALRSIDAVGRSARIKLTER